MNFVKLTTHRNGKPILVNMDTVGHVAVEDERTMLILANSDDGIPVMESFDQVEQLLFPKPASTISANKKELIAALNMLVALFADVAYDRAEKEAIANAIELANRG